MTTDVSKIRNSKLFIVALLSLVFCPHSSEARETSHQPAPSLAQKITDTKADSLAWQIQSSSKAETYCIVADTQGNLFIGGSFSDTITFDGNIFVAKGQMDGFIAKYDASGTWQWSRQMEGLASDFVCSIAVDSDSSLYATGVFQGTARFGGTTLEAKNQGAFLVKYDVGGTPSWAVEIGQGHKDLGRSVALDQEGNVYVCGHWGSAAFKLPFTPGEGTSAFLAKYDAKGTLRWLNRLQGGASYGESVAVDGEGNAYMAGMFMDTLLIGSKRLVSRIDQRSFLKSMPEGFIIKYDQEGNYQWVQQMGGKGPDGFSDVATDAFGNVYVAGMFGNSESTFGTTPLFSEDQMPNTPVNMDNFAAKLRGDGRIEWIVNKIQTSGSGRSLVIDPSGNVYLVGNIGRQSKVVDQVLTADGENDIVIIQLTDDGKVQRIRKVGGPNRERVSCIALGPKGEILLTGTFQGTTKLAGKSLTASGNSSIFVVKFVAE